jgi:hypothetical protein
MGAFWQVSWDVLAPANSLASLHVTCLEREWDHAHFDTRSYHNDVLAPPHKPLYRSDLGRCSTCIDDRDLFDTHGPLHNYALHAYYWGPKSLAPPMHAISLLNRHGNGEGTRGGSRAERA